MENDFLLKSLDIAKISYKIDEPLAQKSTFKIGSTAAIYIIPKTTEEFISVTGAVNASEEKYFILGGGSNVIFPDKPFDGVIISTECLNNFTKTDDDLPDNLPQDTVLIKCQTGTRIQTLVNFCTKSNISGLEEFAGLPGTVGGTLYMNARCFNKSISDIIYDTTSFTVLNHQKLTEKTSPFNPQEWDYKKSPFQTQKDQPAKIITEATFILKQKSPQEHDDIEKACQKYIKERQDKGHFKYPSAGSVFKNNHLFGKPSGQLIDEAGLKGTIIGGAQIAPFHGNFIININHASADDIKELVKLAKKTVKEKFNFDLENEIIFLEN